MPSLPYRYLLLFKHIGKLHLLEYVHTEKNVNVSKLNFNKDKLLI